MAAAALMLSDKQLLPPCASLLFAALLHCVYVPSSESTLVHFRGADASSLAKHHFLFSVWFPSREE